MAGYSIVALNDMLGEYGEDKVRLFLSTFSCPLHLDVEIFLRQKAIVFEQQGLARTHIVFASHKKKPVLVGYFALTSKVIVAKKSVFSGSMRKRLSKFAKHNMDSDSCILPAPLIGQLGKNFHGGYNKQITGTELLALACDTVAEAQLLIGGSKVVYLECEDKPRLTDFYSRNGFFNFGERPLEESEKTTHSGTYLVQMMKYLG